MKTKICFINTGSIWGGGESWQYETILDFKNDYEIVSISHPKGKLSQQLQEQGIKTYALVLGSLSFLNPWLLYKAYRLLKMIRPSTIMFNISADFKVFALIAKLAGVKSILYRRDNGSAIKPNLINQYALKRISHFLPCSEFIGRIANEKKSGLVPNNKITVIPNSISLTKWDNLSYEELNISPPNNCYIFGCIGRLSKEKGQLFLPEIAKEISKTHQNFKILIAGTGELKAEIEAKIKEHDVGQHFEFLGFVKSNKAFTESVDCLLLPSYWEGLPTTAIEAMACQKTVIAFNVTGNPEIVVHEKTGLLAKPFNVKDFASKAVTLLEDPKLGETLGKDGRILVEQKFSKEVTNKELRKYFI